MATGTPVPERGRTWLVRRAERIYGPRLGQLQHSALSWHVRWKLLPWFIAAGFLFGTIAEFTGQPTSSRGPGLFSNVPMYIAASLVTGLVLWSLTLLWSFRRLLVFERGLLYRYSQKHAARAIFWEDIDAGSLRSVMASDGTDADLLLKTRSPEAKVPLGVRGQYAVVFLATDSTPLPPRTPTEGPDTSGKAPQFFTFTTKESPDQLVGIIQRHLTVAGVSDAGAGLQTAPATVLHTPVSLD